MSDNPIHDHADAADRARTVTTTPEPAAGLPGLYLGLLDTDTPRSRHEAAVIRELLQDPATPPLPKALLGREITALRAVLPADVLDHRDAEAAVTLAACGAYITAALYGGAATGRVHRIIGDLEREEYGVLAAYHHGFGLAESVAQLYVHAVRLGMPAEEFLDAMVAETYSDAVYGNGRRRDNPDGFDELRSADLVYAHALASGYDYDRAERIRFAVLGTGFDEATKAQAGSADPDPVVQAVAGVDLATLAAPDGVRAAMDLAVEDGMSARYNPDRVLGRALAEHGMRVATVADALAFIDAHPDHRPSRDDGSPTPQTVREFFARRLIGNGGFALAHRYPPTWTGDDPRQREANARDSVALGEAIESGEMTVVAAYAAAAYLGRR
ncbi:hypothetical protein [Nocardia brasiliensis]|uniref:hypothetical protein n=1 Tax=Nocardia brasiliensis TaxID=37326 RepID=UPI0024560AC6|nr:hypothetical protein [Nocardia brasiliensis]